MVYRPLRYEQIMKAADAFDVRARRMFNGMGIYTGERMFAFLIGDEVGLKLSPDDLERALAIPGAEVLKTESGEPMREYVRMPKSVLDAPDQFSDWLELSAMYVQNKVCG